MSKAHLTAIARRALSTPAKYLRDHSLLEGRTLDFGCGRGFDAQELGIEGYDPHYFPAQPLGKYCTIMCNFVLNVIESKKERDAVVARIRSLLLSGGTAYISVRNDKSALKGFTSKGTWQGFIELDLPIVKRTSNYVMYKLEKKNENDPS